MVITGTMVLSARCADIDGTQLRGRKNSFTSPLFVGSRSFVIPPPVARPAGVRGTTLLAGSWA